MATVTWQCADGSEVVAEVANGLSLMEAAVNLNVGGIYGDCGGALSCATCHVVVADSWHAKLPSMSEMENEMLEMVEGGRQPTSRLSCQLRVDDSFEGLLLKVVSV